MNKVFCSSCGHKNVYEVWKSATPEDANMTPLERRSPNLPEGDALLKQSQADCGSSRTTQDIDG